MSLSAAFLFARWVATSFGRSHAVWVHHQTFACVACVIHLTLRGFCVVELRMWSTKSCLPKPPPLQLKPQTLHHRCSDLPLNPPLAAVPTSTRRKARAITVPRSSCCSSSWLPPWPHMASGDSVVGTKPYRTSKPRSTPCCRDSSKENPHRQPAATPSYPATYLAKMHIFSLWLCLVSVSSMHCNHIQHSLSCPLSSRGKCDIPLLLAILLFGLTLFDLLPDFALRRPPPERQTVEHHARATERHG